MGTIEAQLGGASSDFFESGSWPVLVAPSDCYRFPRMAPVPAPEPDCHLEQLVQYTCQYDDRKRTVNCTPFSRIFRL